MRGLILSGIPELFILSLVFMLGGGDEYTAILAAAVLHELGHIIAAVILRVKMRFCRSGIAGLCLMYDFSTVSHLREAAVCLAGPAVGLGIFFIGYKSGNVSYFAAASLGLTVFNLMPVSFLDGGCALSAVLSVFLKPVSVWIICRALSVVFTILLWITSVMLLLQMNGDISLMTAAVYLLYRLFSEC